MLCVVSYRLRNPVLYQSLGEIGYYLSKAEIGTVRRCGSEAERSRNSKLRWVGGTHTAHHGLTYRALTRRPGPVCLKSRRTGQIKTATMQLTEFLGQRHTCTFMLETRKKHNSTLAPLAPIDCFYFSPLVLRLQHRPAFTGEAFSIWKVSPQPNYVHNKQECSVHWLLWERNVYK